MNGNRNVNCALRTIEVPFSVHKIRLKLCFELKWKILLWKSLRFCFLAIKQELYTYLKANSIQEQVKMAPVQYISNFSYHIDLVETGPRWEPACYCI